ncbi:MAG: hypothetical protein LBL18_01350 [Bacteroidales bacterium]|nr:hypothetical protein [Bacteroidales bacterium]
MKERKKTDFLRCNQTGKYSYKRIVGFCAFIVAAILAVFGKFIGEIEEVAIIEFLGLTAFSMGATSYEHGRAVKSSPLLKNQEESIEYGND